ncbi:MAG: PQQ-binding-like beta-propeller repeat protein [Bacteroidetes bacterium]|nr:PQQ-binding-like beta-propeller repeat protein [Bacteroidota bacterium]
MKKCKNIFLVILINLSITTSQTFFEKLKIENVGKDTLIRPFDSNNPKAILRIINSSTATSPNNISIKVREQNSTLENPGLAIFPNGGPLVELAAGETTFVSCWLRGLWEGGIQVDSNLQARTIDFKFIRQSPASTDSINYSRKFYISNYIKQNHPEGDYLIKGVVKLPTGVLLNPPQISILTAYWISTPISTTLINNEYTFSTSIKSSLLNNRNWYLKISLNGCNDTLLKISNNKSEFNITLSKQTENIIPDFKLIVPPINTTNGFWRGAVSESEGTVALIPGQENWKITNGCKDSITVSNSILYKYNFKTGAKIWEHKTGWETWGGDMSADGKYVVYAFETGKFGNCYSPTFTVRALNGETGQILWERKNDKILESKELAISPNNKFVAVGSLAMVALLNLNNGSTLWTTSTNLNMGQVRKLAFDKKSEYLYSGSGDNYLRKIRVLDGAIIWKTFIWGWPFVNGFSMNYDGSKIVVGTKSCDVTQINTSDGRIDWHFETGNFDDAIYSPDGKYISTFSGFILNSANGEVIGKTSSATTFFSSNSKMVFKLPNQIFYYYLAGNPLGKTNISGITLASAPGSQSQWGYLSSNDKFAIISARDMGYNNGPPIPSQGILFYENHISVSVEKRDGNNPTNFILKQNFPNPFNPSTTIEFQLPQKCFVTLKIYNLLGDEVETLINELKAPGKFSVKYFPKKISSGIYFYKLTAGNFISTKKFIFIK